MSSRGKKLLEMRRESAVLECSCCQTTLRSLFSFSQAKVKPEETRTGSGRTSNHRRRSSASPPFALLPSIRTSPLPEPAFSPGSAAAMGRRRLDKSVAAVKVSLDPRRDFGESMLQMILEEEIFAWEDLQELLHRFLFLNSRRHRDAILHAFSEILATVFSASG